jgi:hypothetical protein
MPSKRQVDLEIALVLLTLLIIARLTWIQWKRP